MTNKTLCIGLVAMGLCIIAYSGLRAARKWQQPNVNERPAMTVGQHLRHQYWLEEIGEAREVRTLEEAFIAARSLRHSVPQLTYYTESERARLDFALDALEAGLVASETAGRTARGDWYAEYLAGLSRVNLQGLLEVDNTRYTRSDYVFLIAAIALLIWVFWRPATR